MSDLNRGVVLTREHLNETGQTQADLARAARASAVTVLHWMRGDFKPSAPRRRRIRTWTKGRVSVEAWDQPALPTRSAA